VSGRTPALVVLEDQHCLAFLDKRPVFPGHTLLVPKRHVPTLLELPDEMALPVLANARLLTAALMAALGAQGSYVAMNNVVSQSVPHLHVHVVPRRFKDGLKGFFWPRHPYADDAAAEEVQERLMAAVARLRTGS